MPYIRRMVKYLIVYQLPLKIMLAKNMQLHGGNAQVKRSKKKLYVLYHFNYMKRMKRTREIHQMLTVAAFVCCNYG